jgi:hypothetical protein
MLQTLLAWICAAVGAAALVYGFVVAFRRHDEATTVPPPVARAGLLTPTEARFFRALEQALPAYRVFPQVSMGALLRAQVPESSPLFWPAYKTFGLKIVDFVVCDSASLRPLLVVELDDPSHDAKRAKDAQRDALLANAGLPVVRVDVREQLGPQALQARLAKTLDRKALQAPPLKAAEDVKSAPASRDAARSAPGPTAQCSPAGKR